MTARAPETRTVDVAALKNLLARVDRGEATLDAESIGQIEAALDTLMWLQVELARKRVQFESLKRQLFGPTSEKTRDVLANAASGVADPTPPADVEGDSAPQAGEAEATSGPAQDGAAPAKSKPKPKGHGRLGADAYTGAERTATHPEGIRRGDRCPDCQKGCVYPTREQVIVRLFGQPSLGAERLGRHGLRCNLCDATFRAPMPEAFAGPKYDDTATAMILLEKYGLGVPFYRLQSRQKSLGVPVPASTMWGLAAAGRDKLRPAFHELQRQGAQAEIFHLDDTRMPVLSLIAENARLEKDGTGKERTGMFTTGIVAVTAEHEITLFFTGRRHAGENLAALSQERAEGLDQPIQMGDAAQRNTSAGLDTLPAFCLPHGRRKFVDLSAIFPGAVRHVLESLAQVFYHDKLSRERALSPEGRLSFHQEHSAPLMEGLRAWMEQQLDDHQVERNSALGKAFAYMLNHWDGLTLFLRRAGAPLTNNICERALKRIVLHRKNALFFKTENGANVGDVTMSLIHTAIRAGANPFDYLVALLQNHKLVAADPAAWMPWNYRDRASPSLSASDLAA